MPPPQSFILRSETMEVLVDRCALLVDELQEMLQEIGAVASVLKGLPACSSRMERWERECQEQMAINKEILRYRAEVEEPAFAMVRERKACRAASGAAAGARKEPVTFPFTCADADYYRKVLDGIDVRLPPQLAAAPDVNSLTIAISWPPTHPLRGHPIGGYIASCHDYYLALHLGPSSSLGCYLVFNSRANSVAVVPPLPVRCVTNRSHCSIGDGFAILRHSIDDGCYLLAELYPRQGPRSYLPSNKATLFVWFSPGSGPLANQWIQKEVVLPLPADEEKEGRYDFRANMVLQVSRTSLCWVDLHTGILVCNHLNRLADGDDDLVFHFIPLPEECATKPDLRYAPRWQPEDYRSMTCMDSENITFVCMDGYKKGHPHSEVMLTTWSLKFPLENHWSWEKRRVFSARDLFDGLPFFKDDTRLQRLMPRCPVISSVQPDVVYLSVADSQYNYEHERWEAAGFYELSIDMTLPRVVASRLHSCRPLILLRRG